MWLKRMKLQRLVLCQDISLLMRRVPDLYLWQHEIFSTPQWQRWETKFHNAHLNHTKLIQTTLLNLALELMSNMNARFDHVEQSQKQILAAMRTATKASQLHSQMMVDIISGKLTPRTSWCWTDAPACGPSSNSLPVASLPCMSRLWTTCNPQHHQHRFHLSPRQALPILPAYLPCQLLCRGPRLSLDRFSSGNLSSSSSRALAHCSLTCHRRFHIHETGIKIREN